MPDNLSILQKERSFNSAKIRIFELKTSQIIITFAVVSIDPVEDVERAVDAESKEIV